MQEDDDRRALGVGRWPIDAHGQVVTVRSGDGPVLHGGHLGATGRAEGRVRGPQGLRCGVDHGRAGALDEVQDGAEVVGDRHLWSASGGQTVGLVLVLGGVHPLAAVVLAITTTHPG